MKRDYVFRSLAEAENALAQIPAEHPDELKIGSHMVGRTPPRRKVGVIRETASGYVVTIRADVRARVHVTLGNLAVRSEAARRSIAEESA